jgi:hypothetical protein
MRLPMVYGMPGRVFSIPMPAPVKPGATMCASSSALLQAMRAIAHIRAMVRRTHDASDHLAGPLSQSAGTGWA